MIRIGDLLNTYPSPSNRDKLSILTILRVKRAFVFHLSVFDKYINKWKPNYLLFTVLKHIFSDFSTENS